tara:strand:+ start:139 stop:405 length:267 start_codon:yes stop_codon:yes gene_type:complete
MSMRSLDRELRFIGTKHPVLIEDNFYTVTQYAEIIGIVPSTFAQRVRRKWEVDDTMTYKKFQRSSKMLRNIKTKQQAFSQEWLVKSIV